MHDPNTAAPSAAAPPSGRGRAFHLAGRLGLGSIRGRYLYVAGLFVALLLAAAWMAQYMVNDAAQESTGNVSEREQMSHLIRDMSDEMWAAETALQGYLLEPNAKDRKTAVALLDDLITDATELAATAWAQRAAQARPHARTLERDLADLRHAVIEVMAVREDAERLFPAMRIMLDEMLPQNVEFDTAAALGLLEAEQLSHVPGQIEVHRALTEIRYAWALAISAFRMFVANRFGIFPGSIEDGMRAQAHNVDFFLEKVSRGLDELARMENDGKLEFQQIESLAKMTTIRTRWEKSFRETGRIYSSANWRADVPILKTRVRPLSDRIWATLRALEKNLEAASTGDVSRLAGTADRLSEAIWLIFLLAVALTLTGYLFFEATVRRPIARVASALKAEARGLTGAVLRTTATAETNDLIDAFDHMRKQVHARQQRLETILDNAAEGILTFDKGGLVRSLNRAAERLFGYSERELTGKEISLLIPPPENRDRRDGYLEHFMRHEVHRLIGREGEVNARHKDGSTFPMALKVSEIVLDGQPLYTALAADISERKALVDHLKQMAEHDGLTGLYNRTYFRDELERLVERVRRTEDSPCAVLYVDLDNFKYVNDTLGHAAGDQLLLEVASVLNKRARKSDLIARLGGDEFTVLLYSITEAQAEATAESYRRGLAEYRFKSGSERVDIGCSIGVSFITPQTKSAEEVLARADIACHLAKRGGRNRVHLFHPRDEESVANMSLDMGWSRRIKDAIEHGQFALACQPIVDTHSGRIECYEVLIRLRDDNGDLVMPGGFLPSAERFGLSAEIDKWVILNAIDTLADQRQRLPDLRYSVNLSGQTLTDTGVCKLILERLDQTGLDPSALTFEVTETVAIADMSLAESFLSALQKMGCKTALDDFGSGMSSFAYLRDLPVDFVKIDGRFVRNMAESPVDQAMVKAMNDIAHALGKHTIAEFVEDERCLKLLAEFGVDYAQGYHLGRPDIVMPCAAIAAHANISGSCRLPR